MTPPGIDPETVRLVAQCLNLYATPGPRFIKSFTNYKRVLTFRYTLQPTHTHTPAMPRHCNGPPPLLHMVSPPVSCQTGETPLCNDSCSHIAMCLVRRTGYCSHLSSAHTSKNSGQLFHCEAVSFIVTLFNNGTSTGEVIDLW